jgi:hypothetical protein
LWYLGSLEDTYRLAGELNRYTASHLAEMTLQIITTGKTNNKQQKTL